MSEGRGCDSEIRSCIIAICEISAIGKIVGFLEGIGTLSEGGGMLRW
jgi:hypothetical protein